VHKYREGAQSRASSRRSCRDAAGPAEQRSAIPSARESSTVTDELERGWKRRLSNGPELSLVGGTRRVGGSKVGREAREAPASCASTVEGTWSEADRLGPQGAGWSGEGLGRRRGCRGRPIPGGHPTTTRVSKLLWSGAIGKVAQGRARQGSIQSMSPRGLARARQGRSPGPRSFTGALRIAGKPGVRERGLVVPNGRLAARAALVTEPPHTPDVPCPSG
jgi:hypothetical protein